MKIIYDLDDTFRFGRNKGKTVRTLLLENPGYVDWLIRNVDIFVLSENAMKEALIVTDYKKITNKDLENSKVNQSDSIFSMLKVYGWSFDFSSQELIQINKNKLIRNTATYKENYCQDINWLEDAAGTDDPDVIRDVYWNLD